MRAMTQTHSGHRCQQSFLGERHERNEHRSWLVVLLTTVMMVGEIAGGTYYGSMALVADGWHMATHAAALTIAALAYRYARHHGHEVPQRAHHWSLIGDSEFREGSLLEAR